MRKLLILALFFSVFGCSTVRTFTLPETQEKTIYKEIERVDTVFQNVYKYITVKGDTVYERDSVLIYRYKYVTKCDTFVQVDSIPYPVEVTKEVRMRNGYDKFTASGFWVFVGIIFLYIAWRLLRNKIRAFLGV